MNPASNDPTLIGRYLADRLTPEERLQLESALHRDPDLLAELEATSRLKVGLARLRETGQLEGLLQDTPYRTVSRMLPLVAGLAALIIGVVFWRSAPHPAAPPTWLAKSPALLTSNTQGLLPVRMTIAVFRKRSGGPDAQASVPEGRGAVELRVLPATPVPSAHYRLQLTQIRDNESQETVGNVDDLTPATDGFVTAYVDASHLSSGTYRVLLSAVTPSGTESPPEKFQMTLTRRAEP